jgi:hypothetical protein
LAFNLKDGQMAHQDRGLAPRIATLPACEPKKSRDYLSVGCDTDGSRFGEQFWDNKVLPTQVMPEEARAEKKW